MPGRETQKAVLASAVARSIPAVLSADRSSRNDATVRNNSDEQPRRRTNIRADHVAPAGGEDAVEAGKRELLAEVIGHRLAEVRRARGLTQQQVADRMGVTKGRISQIERGKISGHDVVARYAGALGGRLHQAIYFDDGRHHRHRVVELAARQRDLPRPNKSHRQPT